MISPLPKSIKKIKIKRDIKIVDSLSDNIEIIINIFDKRKV